MLGANISVSSGAQSFVVRGSTLTRNYAGTMALVREILLEPRFAEEEFELAKQRVQASLRRRASSPNSVAGDLFSRLLYGDHILGTNPLGTQESVESIEIADLRAYYQRALLPNVASFHVAGAIGREEAEASLQDLATTWEPGELDFPAPPTWDPERAGVYFADVPGAAQSVLRIGYLALAEPDPEFYPATVMNFRLGGGGFASGKSSTNTAPPSAPGTSRPRRGSCCAPTPAPSKPSAPSSASSPT